MNFAKLAGKGDPAFSLPGIFYTTEKDFLKQQNTSLNYFLNMYSIFMQSLLLRLL